VYITCFFSLSLSYKAILLGWQPEVWLSYPGRWFCNTAQFTWIYNIHIFCTFSLHFLTQFVWFDLSWNTIFHSSFFVVLHGLVIRYINALWFMFGNSQRIFGSAFMLQLIEIRMCLFLLFSVSFLFLLCMVDQASLPVSFFSVHYELSYHIEYWLYYHIVFYCSNCFFLLNYS